MADTPTPSDPVAAIREALALGPTPGQWRAVSARNSMPAVFAGPITIAHVFNPPVGDAEANAALIAACNPVAIAALLAQLEAAQQDQARLDWLISQDDCVVNEGLNGFWLCWIDEHDPTKTVYQEGSHATARAAIDAALAEQQKGDKP